MSVYVVQVPAKKEETVAKACRDGLGFDEAGVYVPVRELKKKFRGEKRTVTSVLFPGYVFFETEDAQKLFFDLKKIKIMTKLLKTGNEFTPLSKDEERFLYRLTGSSHRAEVSTGLKEGDEVKIITGPLSSFKGMIRKINRHRNTAVLETRLLGENRQIVLGLEILESQ